MTARPRRLLRLALPLILPLLAGCGSVRPYAGVGIAGPSWSYGPLRVGTGANIGVTLPTIHR